MINKDTTCTHDTANQSGSFPPSRHPGYTHSTGSNLKQKTLNMTPTPDTPHHSPYRKGKWTVTMLKEELKQRNLTLSGKKAELIHRLESDDVSRGAGTSSSPSRIKSVETQLTSLGQAVESQSSPIKRVSAPPAKTPRQSLNPEEAQLLSRLTVTQLQQELRKRGLSPLGRKDELVARLTMTPKDAEELTPRIVKPKSPISTMVWDSSSENTNTLISQSRNLWLAGETNLQKGNFVKCIHSRQRLWIGSQG